MKPKPTRCFARVTAILFALLGAHFPPASAAPRSMLDAAWHKAVSLAGVEAAGLAQPEVFFEFSGSGQPGNILAEYVPFAHEVRIYQIDQVPVHHLLVHEFLHAIYFQTQAGSLSLAELAQADPSEPWVRERMSSARRR